MTTPQEPQKGMMEEIERIFLKGKHEGMSWESAEPLIHHQLQKARTDWLREIYKELEPFSPDYYDTTPTADELTANRYTRAMLNKLQTIIDRYQSELDQPDALTK